MELFLSIKNNIIFIYCYQVKKNPFAELFLSRKQ